MTKIQKKGIGQSFGTFGEILQGELPNGKRFLVTLPIDRYSTCSFFPGAHKLTVVPSKKIKAQKFLSILLKNLNLPMTGTYHLQSNIPIGKGLASSSADLVAISRAISDYYNIEIPNTLTEDVLARVEPTDGVIHDGIVSYYYLEAKLHKKLGDVPPMTILGVDEGGQVDTQAYNLLKKKYTESEHEYFQKLLSDLDLAIRGGNLNLMGKIATKSAEINQKFLRKRYFDQFLEVSEHLDALGVVTTHSGTYLGILLDENSPEIDTQIKEGTNILRTLSKKVDIFKVGMNGSHLSTYYEDFPKLVASN